MIATTLNGVPYTDEIQMSDQWVRDRAAMKILHRKDPKQRDAVGRYPLAQAIERGYRDTFHFLLDHGAYLGVPFDSEYSVFEVLLYHDLSLIDEGLAHVQWRGYTQDQKGVLLAQAYGVLFRGKSALTRTWVEEFKTNVLGLGVE